MATFDDYLSTGSGRVFFRLVIEGCPVQFVSDPAMECELDDERKVVAGLVADGIEIDESVYMPGAELNIKLGSIQIEERHWQNDPVGYPAMATQVFTSWAGAQMVARLTAAVTSIATSIEVDGAAALTAGQFVHVGTEVWRVDSIDTVGDAATRGSITVTRARWDTTAQAFPFDVPTATGFVTNYTPLTSAPTGYAGRRVWLYGHGDSDTIDTAAPASSGTIIWRGILARDPELTDSRMWSLSVESRLSLFNAEIGRGIEGGTRLRGIYYSARACLYLGFMKLSGTTSAGSVDASHRFYFFGFYETQDAFCSELTRQLNADATLSGWGIRCTARPTVDGGFGPHSGGWDLFITVNDKYIAVEGGSPIDGSFDGTLIRQVLGGGWATTITAATEYRCGWGPVSPSPTGISLAVPLDQARRVPRAYYFENPVIQYGPALPAVDISDYPLQNFYLDFSTAIGTSGRISIQPPTPVGSTTAPAAEEFSCNLETGGWIRLSTSAILPPFGCSGDYQAEFSFVESFGTTGAGVTLADFMANVIGIAPDRCNSGAPFILNDDCADWSAEVDAVVAGTPSLASRLYSFTKPKKLIDVIREECKLHGLYLCLDDESKITVRRLPAPSSTTPSITLSATNHTPGDDFGTMRISPDGVIAKVLFKGNYDPAEDKHQSERTFTNLGAVATLKGKGQTLEIAPVGRSLTPSTDGGDIPLEDARELVNSALTLFGANYYVYEIPVAMTVHGARLGDEILVTVPQLPYAGARGAHTSGGGLSSRRGFVVGRRFMYGAEPGGSLWVMVLGVNTAGYAPTCRVSSASGSGTSWSFTMETNRYTVPTAYDAQFFSTGYKIVLVEWDAEVPRRYTGTVASQAANVIGVTFDASFPGLGSATWELIFADSATTAITTAQKAYVYMSDPTGRIAYSDGTSDPPRVFG